MATKQNLAERLGGVGVVPLIQADAPEVAIATGRALVAGGLPILELVLRTPEALSCLQALSKALPEAWVGAGTVLDRAQAEAAIGAGASFLVSPGLDDGVVEAAMAHGLPVFPGTATATEIQRARNLGLRIVKFFPAGAAGGTAMIKALSAAYGQMKFMPTGGVTAANLAEYLAVPSVVACGGSWLTPATAVAAGDFDTITQLASEATDIVRTVRGNVL